MDLRASIKNAGPMSRIGTFRISGKMSDLSPQSGLSSNKGDFRQVPVRVINFEQIWHPFRFSLGWSLTAEVADE